MCCVLCAVCCVLCCSVVLLHPLFHHLFIAPSPFVFHVSSLTGVGARQADLQALIAVIEANIAGASHNLTTSASTGTHSLTHSHSHSHSHSLTFLICTSSAPPPFFFLWFSIVRPRWWWEEGGAVWCTASPIAAQTTDTATAGHGKVAVWR